MPTLDRQAQMLLMATAARGHPSTSLPGLHELQSFSTVTHVCQASPIQVRHTNQAGRPVDASDGGARRPVHCCADMAGVAAVYAFTNYAAWPEADISGCLDALSSVDWARFGAEAEVPPLPLSLQSKILGLRCQLSSLRMISCCL